MIFFDMDGVLAVYEPADYRGNPMPFARKGIHYFLERPLDRDALDFMDALADEVGSKSMFALSTMSAPALHDAQLGFEHKRDKHLWLHQVCSERNRPTPPLLMARQGMLSKPTAAMLLLQRKLDRCDILVDDFNPNLADWAHRGGTSVKWLNGDNSAASWRGMSVSARTWRDAMPPLVATASKRPKAAPFAKKEPEALWDL